MRLWILVLLAAMLTELSAGMSETAAAVFHTPDDIAVLLTEPAESSDDAPSESPDDACLYRIPRMLPSAALCPGSEMPPATIRPTRELQAFRLAGRLIIHTGRAACRIFCIYRI